MSGTGAKTQPGEIGERGQLVQGDHQSVSEHARAQERDQPQSRGRGASPEHGQPEVEPDHVGARRPKLAQQREAGAGAIPSPNSTHVDASNALAVGRSGPLVGEDDHRSRTDQDRRRPASEDRRARAVATSNPHPLTYVGRERDRAVTSAYKSRNRAAHRSSPNSAAASSRAEHPRRAKAGGSSRSSAIPSARPTASPTGATRPASGASSGMMPTLVPTTGRPHAAASSAAIPCASCRELSTNS